MNFIESIKSSLYKYIEFTGRASRSEYWYFFLFIAILGNCAAVLDAAIAGQSFLSYDEFFGPASSIYYLLTTLPSISLSVRRLHDVGRSGWWLLIIFTVVGIFLLFFWCFKKGDEGSNHYGNNTLSGSKDNGSEKTISKSVKYFLIAPASIIILFLFIFGLLMMSGFLPDGKVYKNSQISKSVITKLINHKIIEKNDTVKFFYSEGFLSIMEGGQLITNNKLIVYEENEQGIIDTSKMFIKNIAKIEIQEKGDSINDNLYKIIGNNNAKFESLLIYLPASSSKNIHFLEALKKN